MSTESDAQSANTISIGELVRAVTRLEGVISQQSQMYVLSSLYQSEQAALNRRLDVLDKEIEADRQDRKVLFRTVLAAFILPALLLLFNVLILTRGGLA